MHRMHICQNVQYGTKSHNAVFNLTIHVKHTAYSWNTLQLVKLATDQQWPMELRVNKKMQEKAKTVGYVSKKRNIKLLPTSAQPLSHPDFPALFPILCKTITSSYSVLFVDMLSAAKALWFYSGYRVLLGMMWSSGNSNLMKDIKVD